MVAAPIFHVNGDDPEACIRVARLAFAFRQEFHKDVVIDLICYRRRGHNEGDDPSFTQPRMYDLIEKKRSTRKLYTEALIGRGDITVEDAEAVMTRFQQRLESVFREVRDPGLPARELDLNRVPVYPSKAGADHGTAISAEVLKKIADAHTTFPEGFAVHPKVMPQLQRRAAAITQGPIDWATGEILALGALLLEGRTVRLTGQDTRRGTFVQRFASVVDRVTGESWVPLKHLDDDQGKFHVFDSLLSEYAAMGFEYGYSVARPDALVLWEAQFGDFANGAQTIIDEFITSGEAKWTQKSGVVLLLPHGYEGQGPDHSSARIERFLTLGAENAITVAQPSTPASHFHRLRLQALDELHRPLIVMTPKSMLRNKQAVSQPEDFTEGTLAAGARRPDGVGPQPGREGHPLLGQGALGPGDPPPAGRSGRARSRSSPSSASIRCRRRRSSSDLPVHPGARGAVGAGRAGQPGGVALHGSQPARGLGRRCPGPGLAAGPDHPAELVGAIGRLRQGPRSAAAGPAGRGHRLSRRMYFTDRGIEELATRRGEEEVSVAWLAEQLRLFVDLHPDFEIPVERLATWLARLDDDESEQHRRRAPSSAPSSSAPAGNPMGSGRPRAGST